MRRDPTEVAKAKLAIAHSSANYAEFLQALYEMLIQESDISIPVDRKIWYRAASTHTLTAKHCLENIP